MIRLHSLPPVADSRSRVLLLGTMPGPLSLEKGEYYAHPRNAFWRIVAQLFQFDPALPYPLRLERLLSERIALWDVLRSCEREGAADAAIRAEVPNDFRVFMRGHARIEYVFFNGAKAESFFLRHVQPQFRPALDVLHLQRLPSTSPANAGMPFEDKVAAWRAIATPLPEV